MAVGFAQLPEDLKEALCYPRDRLQDRMRECEEVVISFRGTGQRLSQLAPLDKGTDSIVFLNVELNRVVKIRRLDAEKSLSGEGTVLLYLNYRSPMKIAPEVYMFNDSLIVMEYIRGVKIKDLDKVAREADEVKKIVCKILMKAMLLDALKINHGQLSRAYEHIIIRSDGDPIFVDFGNSSFTQRPHNLTSVWSFLRNRGLLDFVGYEVKAIDFAKRLKRGDAPAVRTLRDACSH